MGRFTLAFGIHNHQPLGNFTAVFDEAHRRAYRPFLELVAGYDDLRLSLHQSGILWEWQKEADPDFFELVGGLVDRGRLELLTGGFYEPILVAVPERDARGQIAMLTDYLQAHFETRPEGLWLAERVWEPHLPGLLAEAGVRWLPIDDTHFLYAGFELSQLTGPFVTEHAGRTVRLLPIQKRLRYLIPFGTVEQVIEELKRQADRDPEGVAVYADDGEKFGVWPNTHHHCYTDRWLERFFEAVLKESDWLRMAPLGEAAAMPPVGRAYLPSASYEEMLHWALPPEAFTEYEALVGLLAEQGLRERFGRFVRGGHWRNFLAKYEEVNLMHKKMLLLSDRLAAAENSRELPEETCRAARRFVYAAQCNCPYWHGVFGGVYLPHIRQAVYANLAAAEHRLNESADPTKVRWTERDIDADGFPEVLVETGTLSLLFRPRRGGTLVDLTLPPQRASLTDVLSRRREGYHARLAGAGKPDGGRSASIHDIVWTKEDDLDRYLVHDWYLKRCFIDHFFGDGVTVESFSRAAYPEEGDFILEPYTATVEPGRGELTLSREGHLYREDGTIVVRVVKRCRFLPGDDTFEMRYELSTPHDRDIPVDFAVENNFTFQAGHAEDRYVLVDGARPENAFLDGSGVYAGVMSVALMDEYRSLGVAVLSEPAAELWRLPVFTVSLSEAGFERVYQGTTLVHRFRLQLSPQPVRLSFRVCAGPSDVVRGHVQPSTEHAGSPDRSR